MFEIRKETYGSGKCLPKIIILVYSLTLCTPHYLKLSTKYKVEIFVTFTGINWLNEGM